MPNWTQEQLNLYLKRNPDSIVDYGMESIHIKKTKPLVQSELSLGGTELFFRMDKDREKRKLETTVQSHYIEWVRLNKMYNEPLRACFAVPNGGLRTKKTAGVMKAEGLEAGVPDLMILSPAKGYAGIIIETKVKYNQPSEDQVEWLNRLSRNNFYCVVCWSTQAMIDVTCWFYDLSDETRHRFPVR